MSNKAKGDTRCTTPSRYSRERSEPLPKHIQTNPTVYKIIKNPGRKVPAFHQGYNAGTSRHQRSIY